MWCTFSILPSSSCQEGKCFSIGRDVGQRSEKLNHLQEGPQEAAKCVMDSHGSRAMGHGSWAMGEK